MTCIQEVTAKHDYAADGLEELSLRKGERLTLLDDSKQWWKVQRINPNATCELNESGFVPSNYVRKVKPSLLASLKNTLGRRKGSSESSNSPSNGHRSKSPGRTHAINTSTVNCTGAPFSNSTTTTAPLPAQRRLGTNAQSRVGSSVGDSGDDDSSLSDNAASNLNTTPIGTARTKFAYTAKRCDEITLMKFDVVDILAKSEDGWWRVRGTSNSGWYPSNYLELYDRETSALPSSSSMSPSPPTSSSPCATPSTPRTGPSALYADTPHPVGTTPSSGCSGVTVIRAKYDYKPAKNDELAFCAGDRLILVDRCPTEGSHWWRASTAQAPPTNSSSSSTAAPPREEGLVPKAYFIEETNAARNSTDSLDDGSSESTSTGGANGGASGGGGSLSSGVGLGKPFVGKDWYFGRIPRSQCDSLLNEHGREGDFIVRDSETNVGGYSISLKAAARNKHFRISVEGSELIIGQQTFTSMDELVTHYKSHPIFRQESEKLFLLRPFVDPQRS